jgi:hypothetical protein
MSTPTLADALSQYGRDAYLLTMADDGPHTSFVSVDLKGNVIACAIGKTAALFCKKTYSKYINNIYSRKDAGGLRHLSCGGARKTGSRFASRAWASAERGRLS